eukprot:743854-Rhodomonas_salina.1
MVTSTRRRRHCPGQTTSAAACHKVKRRVRRNDHTPNGDSTERRRGRKRVKGVARCGRQSAGREGRETRGL